VPRPLVKELPIVRPIQLLPRDAPFDDPNWSYEIKYDGYRGMLYLRGDASHFISRQGKHMSRFDELARALAKELPVKTALLDGEIVVLDKEGRPIFLDLVKNVRQPTYIAFDLLYVDGVDIRPQMLSERRKHLARITPAKSSRFLKISFTEGRGKELFDLICKHDLEGIVAKRLDHPYRKVTPWYKIKNKRYRQLEGRPQFSRKTQSARRR
jgi:bifunctional non-homologous end joining protein LigD